MMGVMREKIFYALTALVFCAFTSTSFARDVSAVQIRYYDGDTLTMNTVGPGEVEIPNLGRYMYLLYGDLGGPEFQSSRRVAISSLCSWLGINGRVANQHLSGQVLLPSHSKSQHVKSGEMAFVRYDLQMASEFLRLLRRSRRGIYLVLSDRPLLQAVRKSDRGAIGKARTKVISLSKLNRNGIHIKVQTMLNAMVHHDPWQTSTIEYLEDRIVRGIGVLDSLIPNDIPGIGGPHTSEILCQFN